MAPSTEPQEDADLEGAELEGAAADATGGAATAAVILAAGGGRRFQGGGHKLLAKIEGRPVITWAVEAAIEAAIGPVLVVTGAVDLVPVLPEGAEIIHNPDWSSGQASSLQTAIAAATRRGCEAVVVGLGDQPFVGPEPWRAVAASSSPIAVATYQGQRRNPVRLHGSVWGLLPATGDEGARVLMRVRPDLVGAVPCEGNPADIDTAEDLDPWN